MKQVDWTNKNVDVSNVVNSTWLLAKRKVNYTSGAMTVSVPGNLNESTDLDISATYEAGKGNVTVSSCSILSSTKRTDGTYSIYVSIKLSNNKTLSWWAGTHDP